ncbi:MAG: CvpA family protein [Bacteroidales bacterium]|nr:CvpA family protein [Candidatus Cacconaster merdequi]
MATIDVIILVCFLPAIYVGIKNGLVRELISLCVVFGGIKLSIKFSPQVIEWLSCHLGMSEFWAKVTSFIVIFLVVAIILSLIGNLIDRIIKISLLGWLNRLLGILLAIALFAIVISTVIYFFDMVNTRLGIISAEKIAESKFVPLLLDLARDIFSNFELKP